MGNYKTYKLFCARVDESGNVEKDSLRELGTLEDTPEAPLSDITGLGFCCIARGKVMARNEELEKENQELKEKIKDLEEDLEEVENDAYNVIVANQAKITKLEEENDDLDNRVYNAEELNECYESRITELEEENEKLKDRLEWVKANPREHRIIKERDELKEMVEYYKKVSDNFSKLSVKYANELNETRIKLKEVQEENKELRSDREKLRNRIIEINKEYDEDVAAYEADMEELYLRIDSLDKENELLKEQAKDHEICYRDLENNWNSIYEQNQELKAGNEELEKKLIDTEHMRDQYRILYDKYQTLFSVTEEMASDLNKLLDDTYDLSNTAYWLNAGFAVRIKECIAPKKDIIKEWSTTMDRERTYYDKQLEVAYRKSRESK